MGQLEDLDIIGQEINEWFRLDFQKQEILFIFCEEWFREICINHGVEIFFYGRKGIQSYFSVKFLIW